MSKTVMTESSDETEQVGYEFAKTLKGGDVVCLYGDLGSGKTTFVKGLAKSLGITSRIISPTFILLRTHILPRTNDQQPIATFYHLDLYRLENESAVESIGLSELFEDHNGIVLIEWAERAKSFLPKKRIDIRFETMNLESRKITIQSVS